MSNALKKIAAVPAERRQRMRNAPSFPSRKGEKLVEGLTKAELIKKYEGAVRTIALKMASRLAAGVDPEDLVSVGFVGLMDAAEKFNPKKGAKFLTYAEIRVRGAILDELRNQDWVPISARRRAKSMEAAAHEIEREKGRRPSEDELGKKIGVSATRLRKFQLDYGTLALVHYGDLSALEREETEAVQNSLQSAQQADPFIEATRKDTRAWFETLFRELPPESQQVLSCYYFRGLRVKEIATIMEVSESRISQIHTRAILRLKRILAEKKQDWKSTFAMLLAA